MMCMLQEVSLKKSIHQRTNEIWSNINHGFIRYVFLKKYSTFMKNVSKL